MARSPSYVLKPTEVKDLLAILDERIDDDVALVSWANSNRDGDSHDRKLAREASRRLPRLVAIVNTLNGVPRTMTDNRDAPGELGTTETDLGDQESVWPDWAPDMHEYIRRSMIFARVVGIIAYVTVLFGWGLFIGWALWGQP